MRDLRDIKRGAQAATPGPWGFPEYMQGSGDLDPFKGFRSGRRVKRSVTNIAARGDEIDLPWMYAGQWMKLIVSEVHCEGDEEWWHIAEPDADFIANARSDVPDLVAQVEADDALLLECEWAATSTVEIDRDGHAGLGPAACPVCGGVQPSGHKDGCQCDSCIFTRGYHIGHVDDCVMKRRCDEARARQAADE